MPGLAVPAAPCQTTPRHANLALPRLAAPAKTYRAMPNRAMPNRVTPSRVALAIKTNYHLTYCSQVVVCVQIYLQFLVLASEPSQKPACTATDSTAAVAVVASGSPVVGRGTTAATNAHTTNTLNVGDLS